MGDKKEESIGWMYEGVKSSVNREDYLLGKKVDKNFEKYSDVVNEQKPEAIDRIIKTRTVTSSVGQKTSSLQTDIIRSEDPFVAVKIREEKKRRELMDNPLMKLKLQKMLKTMMTSKNEKKSKKHKKKQKKTHKRSRSSSSDDTSDESNKKRKRSASPRRRKSRESSSPARKRRDSSSNGRKRSPSRRDDKSRRETERRASVDRKRSRSSERKRSRRDSNNDYRKRSPVRRSRSRSNERRKRDVSKRRSRNISRSRSRSSEDEKPSTSRKEEKQKNYDSHIPQHLRKNREESGSSEDEDDAHKSRNSKFDDEDDSKSLKKSYGLVEMRKKQDTGEISQPTKELKLIKLPTGRGENAGKRKEPRKALTEEEKAARLAEMMGDNVKWRNEARSKNMEKVKNDDEEEKQELDKHGYAPSFIRSQMRNACDDMTVEKRLQSNKGGVQRSHGYMDKSFARK